MEKKRTPFGPATKSGYKIRINQYGIAITQLRGTKRVILPYGGWLCSPNGSPLDNNPNQEACKELGIKITSTSPSFVDRQSLKNYLDTHNLKFKPWNI